jgi:hypothetical protein
MTYALGRGPEYYDVEAIDQIVAQLEKDNGRFTTLLMGVIESAPFQKRRNTAAPAEAPQPKPTPKAKKTNLLPTSLLDYRLGHLNSNYALSEIKSTQSLQRPYAYGTLVAYNPHETFLLRTR